MQVVWQKALGDLRRRPLQTLLLALITAGATAMLSLGILTVAMSGEPYGRLHESIKAPQIWVWLPTAAPFYVDRMRDATGVESLKESKANFIQVTGGTEHVTEEAFLTAFSEGTESVSGLRITEGRHVAANEANAIVLDRSYAAERGIKLGDKLTATTPRGQLSMDVVGLGVHTFACKFPTCKPTQIFASESLYQSLTFPEDGFFLTIHLSNYAQTPAASKQIRQIVNDFAACGCLATEPRVQSYLDVMDIYQFLNALRFSLQVVFGLFAIVAVGLILANVIGGSVLAEWRSIGILKALGFTRRQIIGVYFLQSLLVGLLGSVLGMVVAYLITPAQLKDLADSLGTPQAISFNLPFMIIMPLVGALLTAFFAIPPAMAAARAQPAEAIANGFKMGSNRPARLVEWLWRLRLPLVGLLAVRDAFARPARTLTTMVTIMIAIFVLHFSFTFRAYMVESTTNPAVENRHHDLTVRPNSLSHQEVEEFLSKQSDVSAFHSETRQRVSVPGISYQGAALGYGPGSEKLPYFAQKGRWFQGPDEVVVGVSFLRAIDKRIGETTEITINGTTLPVKIVGQIFDMDFGGNLMVMDQATFAKFDSTTAPSRYLVDLKPNLDAAAISLRFQESTGGGLLSTKLDAAQPPEITAMVGMLQQMSLVLAIIAVISLISSTMMTARERVLDTGILKSLGLTPGGTTTVSMLSAILIGLLGTGIAIPLSQGVTRWLMAGGEDFGFGAFYTPDVGSGLLLAVGVGATLLAVLASLPSAFWSAAVPPARVLVRE